MNVLGQMRMAGLSSRAKFLQFGCKNIVGRTHRTLEILQSKGAAFSSTNYMPLSHLSVKHSFVCNMSVSKDFLAPGYLCIGLNNVTSCRGYAKGQSKVKEKGAKGKKGSQAKAKVELSHEELEEVIEFTKMYGEMEEVLRHLQEEYITQLSLRSSGGAFDGLQVDTPDGRFSLIEVAQIIQKNPNLVVVDVSAISQYVSHVKAALTKSGMNLNPQQDGTTFFIPIPKVTREHREALTKGAKLLSDKAKERLRTIQNGYLKTVNKVKDQHPSNLIHNVQEIVKVTAKNFTIKVDEMKAAKEKELLPK